MEYWSRGPFLIVVLGHISLCLPDCELCLFNSHLYPFHKLINGLQPGEVLSWFKAHIWGLPSIEQKQSLLGCYINVIVILELC